MLGLRPRQPHADGSSIDSDEVYARISESLRANGHYQRERQPFIWYRDAKTDGESVTVEVDFLAGEYGGGGKPTCRDH